MGSQLVDIFYANSVGNDASRRGLVRKNRMFVFSYSGKFIGETESLFFTQSLVKVDVVSLLSWSLGLEVAANIKTKFEKSVTKKHLPDLLSVCNKRSGLIFLGKRGIGEATQYFYVYSRNSNISMEEVFSWLN